MQAGISWVGYARFLIIFFLTGFMVIGFAIAPFIAGAEMLLGEKAAEIVAALVGVAVPLGCLLYCLYRLHGFRAYADDDGVWFYSGYFPWSEAVRGVRWENFDQVLYRPSMFSWFTRSYRVFIKDRYGNTVSVRDLHNGNRWGGSVNYFAMNRKHTPD